MKAKRLLGVLLLATMCFIGLFTLSSCRSEADIVKGLVEQFLIQHHEDPKDGYIFSYVVHYNVKGNDTGMYYPKYPSKYYTITVNNYKNFVVYEGMYNEKN